MENTKTNQTKSKFWVDTVLLLGVMSSTLGGLVAFIVFLNVHNRSEQAESEANINAGIAKTTSSITKLATTIDTTPNRNPALNIKISNIIDNNSPKDIQELETIVKYVLSPKQWDDLTLANKMNFTNWALRQLPEGSSQQDANEFYLTNSLANIIIDKIDFELSSNPSLIDQDLIAQEREFEEWAAKAYPQSNDLNYLPIDVAQNAGNNFKKIFQLKYGIKIQIEKLPGDAKEISHAGLDLSNQHLIGISPVKVLATHLCLKDFLSYQRHEFEHTRQTDDGLRYNADDATLSDKRKLRAVMIFIIHDILDSKFPNLALSERRISRTDPQEYEAYGVGNAKDYVKGQTLYSPLGNFYDAYTQATEKQRKNIRLTAVVNLARAPAVGHPAP